MPRVTHVAKAQQRYKTVPVIDEGTGKPKQTPVMRNGEQRTTKHGRPVFRTVTVDDKSQPLPPYTCDSCHNPIEIGTPYKHITPKSGPYGGYKRTRHASCPTWQVWEYSDSLSARTARISHEFTEALSTVEDASDVESALQDAAQEVRDLAEEKRESAQNIEDGFGHETSTSQELNDVADQLESWADEIEQADVPDFPEPEEQDCEDCEEGKVDGKNCETCDGTGKYTPDEPTDDQIEDWRSEVQDSITIVDECPV